MAKGETGKSFWKNTFSSYKCNIVYNLIVEYCAKLLAIIRKI